MAGAGEDGPGPDRGPLHQQRGHGPGAPLPGGPQRQEHGDRVEERGVLLSSSEGVTRLDTNVCFCTGREN